MAKLPQLKRIFTSDLGEAIVTINRFFSSVYEALNGGLTFEENFDAKLMKVSIVGGEQVTIIPKRQVQGLLMLSCEPAPSAAATPSWTVVGDRILFEIPGLTAGVSYVATILLI